MDELERDNRKNESFDGRASTCILVSKCNRFPPSPMILHCFSRLTFAESPCNKQHKERSEKKQNNTRNGVRRNEVRITIVHGNEIFDQEFCRTLSGPKGNTLHEQQEKCLVVTISL